LKKRDKIHGHLKIVSEKLCFSDIKCMCILFLTSKYFWVFSKGFGSGIEFCVLLKPFLFFLNTVYIWGIFYVGFKNLKSKSHGIAQKFNLLFRNPGAKEQCEACVAEMKQLANAHVKTANKRKSLQA